MLSRFFALVGNHTRIGWPEPGFAGAAPGFGSLLQTILFSLRHFSSSSPRFRLLLATPDRWLRSYRQTRPRPNWRCEYCRTPGGRFRGGLLPWASPDRTGKYIRRNSHAASG